MQQYWFEQISNELGVSTKVLRSQMKDFRASSSVADEIRSFYPTERGIELLGSAFPQIHTIDFILSFLNQYKLGTLPLNITFTRFGKEVIDQSRKRHILSVTKSIGAENLRRKEYWQNRQDHIEEVLCGTYILFRPSLTVSGQKSFRHVYTEVLHIKKSPEFPQVLIAYWRRWTQNQKIFYTGNFFISTNFLYGTFVNRSSDEVIKPVNINILSKHASKRGLRQFILTGSLTGTDFSQDTIIHYPIALKRIKITDIPQPESFFGIEKITGRNFIEYADLLLNNTSTAFDTPEMLEFIKDKHTEVGALDLNSFRQ